MLLLENTIQNYAWGSRTSLSTLLGRPPATQPEAELWIGAHPQAPSKLSDGRSLLEAIRVDPEGMLGSHVRQKFAGQLPFLLKVLAVDAPLSLQAHPNLEQAALGFAREERAGIPLSAPERTYKDTNHKPELLCALTPFEALCGFRPVSEAAALFDMLGVESTDIAAELRAGPDRLRLAFSKLLTLPPASRARVTADVLGRCERASGSGGPFAASLRWATELGRRYPGDIGAVASLLLNHLELGPLEAIFLGAGRLHAYLRGTGVELMASSDNVLRGGLTPKHVDVPELLSVLQFDTPEISPAPTSVGPAGDTIYEAPAPDFRLSRIELAPGEKPFTALVTGPEILLCVDGQALVEVSGASAPGQPPRNARPLRRGQACFMPATSKAYHLRGAGRIFRATAGATA